MDIISLDTKKNKIGESWLNSNFLMKSEKKLKRLDLRILNK